MSAKERAMVAEKVDRFQKFVTLGIFVLAISYGLETAQFLVGDATKEILEDITFPLSILVMIIILPNALHFGYLRYKYKKICLEIEGFVMDAVKRASVMSFSLTFVFMVFLDGFMLFNDEAGGDFFPDMPARFYLKVILCFTLTVQSLFFFWYTRDGAGGDGE